MMRFAFTLVLIWIGLLGSNVRASDDDVLFIRVCSALANARELKTYPFEGLPRTLFEAIAYLRLKVNDYGSIKRLSVFLRTEAKEMPYSEKVKLWHYFTKAFSKDVTAWHSHGFRMNGKYKGMAFLGNVAELDRNTFLFILEDGRVIASKGSKRAVQLKRGLIPSPGARHRVSILDPARNKNLSELLEQELETVLTRDIYNPGMH